LKNYQYEEIICGSLREVLKTKLPFKAPFDIVVRVHKTFSKENLKQIEVEISNLIKALPL